MRIKGLMSLNIKKKSVSAQSSLMLSKFKESLNDALKDQFEEEEDTFQKEKDEMAIKF